MRKTSRKNRCGDQKLPLSEWKVWPVTVVTIRLPAIPRDVFGVEITCHNRWGWRVGLEEVVSILPSVPEESTFQCWEGRQVLSERTCHAFEGNLVGVGGMEWGNPGGAEREGGALTATPLGF